MWPCLFHAPGQSLGNPHGAVSRFSLPQAAAFCRHVKQSIWVLLSSGFLARVFPFSCSREIFFHIWIWIQWLLLKDLNPLPTISPFMQQWTFLLPPQIFYSEVVSRLQTGRGLLRKVLSTWSRMQVLAERESHSWGSNGNILSKNNYNFKGNLLWRAGGKWNLMEVSRHL